MSRKTKIRMLGSDENFENVRKLMRRNKAEFTRMTRFAEADGDNVEQKFIIEGYVKKKKVGKIMDSFAKICDDVSVGV